MMQTQATADWGLAAKARATRTLQDLHVLPLFPVPTLLLLAACLGGFALSAWGMLAGGLSPWLGVPIGAVLVYASFTVLHDGTHRAISRNPLLNEIIGTMGGQILLPGIEVAVYRHLHLEHHKHTGHHTEDPDDILVRPLPGSLPSMVFIDVVWFFWYMKRFNRWPALQNARFVFGFTLYVAWHAAWIASPYATDWLIAWMLPQRLGLGILTYLFAHIQHPPGIMQNDHPLHATVMIERNPLALAFMLGQSAHLMHHLYPQLPFYRLEAGWQAASALLSPRRLNFRGLFDPGNPSAPAAEMPWLEARIAVVEDIAAGIRLFTLEGVQGPLPVFEAGAHVDLRLGPSVVRQYSLIGMPGVAGRWQIAVKREAEGRGGSIAVHERLLAGAAINVGRPRNHFPLTIGSGRHILVAGGIGITPLLSMAYALSGRGFELHVFARDESHAPFGTSLSRFPFRDRIGTHYDQGKGFPETAVAAVLGPWREGDRIYLCGPAGFMAFVTRSATAMGWPEDTISTESFSPQDDTPQKAFTLELARARQQLEVPAGVAITDVLDKARLSVDTLCRRGICGTCRCRLVSGAVVHRDSVLTPAERAAGQFIPCVSRGTGENVVVLDL
ncbi:hypothetical protein D3874_04740 [Oleomonas cavernae]|uniref:2Fe-2S iron-sulfur cluster binding domain-containing protein n=1 Tax=Oleomonas cavernae TaxID=2320859 RepID=A0A418W8U3_9PROT|nr:fatty acid desaturase [Oleomonas cavernae]RJF86416.1 hypothetical protein D3874_04740 [Oleomonas cavernae]